MKALLLSSAAVVSLSLLTPPRANAQKLTTSSQVGQAIIDNGYMDLMRVCNNGRGFNRRGMSYFNQPMDTLLILMNPSIKNISYENRRIYYNGLAWAMRRECPDVY